MDDDSARVEYIQQAFNWVDAHLGQAVQSAYRGDREQALVELEEGLSELGDSDLPIDLKEQVSVRGRYLRYQMECIQQPPNEVTRLRKEIIAELESWKGSIYAENAARVYLLQLRTLAWRDEGIPYPHDKFRADLDMMHNWGWTLEVYIYISTCAFLHRDMEVMEQCFTVFTTHSDGFMADYLWQRVNLMYQIVKDAAVPRDVVEMLKRIEHPHQWIDIERILLPACIEQGLFNDDAACRALGSLLYRMNNSAPEMPKRMQSTGRIRRD